MSRPTRQVALRSEETARAGDAACSRRPRDSFCMERRQLELERNRMGHSYCGSVETGPISGWFVWIFLPFVPWNSLDRPSLVLDIFGTELEVKLTEGNELQETLMWKAFQIGKPGWNVKLTHWIKLGNGHAFCFRSLDVPTIELRRLNHGDWIADCGPSSSPCRSLPQRSHCAAVKCERPFEHHRLVGANCKANLIIPVAFDGLLWSSVSDRPDVEQTWKTAIETNTISDQATMQAR